MTCSALLAFDSVILDIYAPGMRPVSSFFDIFEPLPPPAGPIALLRCVVEHPIVLVLQAIGAATFTQEPVHITDMGARVPTFTDGNPRQGDVAEADADADLMADGLEFGSPNDNKFEKVAPPTDGYDCHGFTFTKGSSGGQRPRRLKRPPRSTGRRCCESGRIF